jgi:hypothetical protein
MYPDELVLVSGNSLRGRILRESLQKIRLATPLGPQEIPWHRIKKVIYATIERGRNADDLFQITGKVDALKKKVATFEEELIIQLELERASEQPEDIDAASAEEEPSERPAPLEDSSREDGA